MRAVPRLFSSLVLVALAVVAGSRAASASFHEMQIEKVLAGVCGDTSRQAVQLRMRASGQNLVNTRQIKAWDANGANPVTLATLGSNVAAFAMGSRILITTAALGAGLGIASDFTLTQAIPDSYLRAGRLTWEDGSGGVYWSLAWGGVTYTGSNAGSTFNDLDGNYGPPFSARLPLGGSEGLFFDGLAGDMSTNNAADYAFDSPITLTNNAGAPATLNSCLFGDGFVTGDLGSWSGSAP